MPARLWRSAKARDTLVPATASEWPMGRCASARASVCLPRMAAGRPVVCVMSATPFVTPLRANARANGDFPLLRAELPNGKEYGLPTVPPTHPAECLPVGGLLRAAQVGSHRRPLLETVAARVDAQFQSPGGMAQFDRLHVRRAAHRFHSRFCSKND